MTYSVTNKDLASISDVEVAFGSTRLLPSREDIPAEFWNGNKYTQLADALFSQRELPKGTIEFRRGFKPEALNRAVKAHLASYAVRHDYKIAGVGLMISHAATLLD